MTMNFGIQISVKSCKNWNCGTCGDCGLHFQSVFQMIVETNLVRNETDLY